MSRQHLKVLAVLCSVISLALPVRTAHAQAITGTVIGTVRDASGAVVAGAQVTATHIETNVPQSTVSSSSGDYTIPNLPPGRYKITAQTKGFATSVAPDINVQVQQTTRVDFSLSPGQTTQEINVTGEAPLVQSTTSDLGHVIESEQIEALPLNGRLFQQLVTIVPGAIQAGWSDFAENPSAAGALTPTQAVVNGLPWSGNYYMVDGVHNSEPLNAFISITPPLDSVDSFKVETSNPNAEYGSFGGALSILRSSPGPIAFTGRFSTFYAMMRSMRAISSPEPERLISRTSSAVCLAVPSLRTSSSFLPIISI